MVDIDKEAEVIGETVAKLAVDNVTHDVNMSNFERKFAEKQFDKLLNFLEK